MSSLLLSITFGQLGCIDTLSCTTKFAELEEFGDTVALVCTLGEMARIAEWRKESIRNVTVIVVLF
jgi:hypothetical protein